MHHLLITHLERTWERRFIHDSFACRRGKGTHAGVTRFRSFARKVTANGTRRAWYLQLDVRGFFVILDRRVLWDGLATVEQDPAVDAVPCLGRVRTADRRPDEPVRSERLPRCGGPVHQA